MLCAAASLPDISPSTPARKAYRARLEVVLRFERLWALGNVLASEADDTLPTTGVRGISYAQAQARLLADRGATHVEPDGFQLLSRQTSYGAIGIYGAVADGLKLLDRRSLRLTPDLGSRLARAIVDETELPAAIRRSALTGEALALDVLTEWGARAHVRAATGEHEARRLRDAATMDPTRARMLVRLAAAPAEEREGELSRFQRIAAAIDDEEEDRDLATAIGVIVAYEAGYQHAQLVLERLLWLCRRATVPRVTRADLDSDEVLVGALDTIGHAVALLRRALEVDGGRVLRRSTGHLERVVRFLDGAASHTTVAGLVGAVLARHRDVQEGKIVGGRRKLPWLEAVGDGLGLTLTQVGGLRHEARTPAEIAPHPYRTAAADALVRAAHGL